MALVVLAGIVAAQINVNYYVITPGDATPVSQYIEVPAQYNHPVTGQILLTDVFVSQLNALNYLQYRFFDSNDEIYSSQTLLGPSTNESEYLDQGYLEMAQAQNYATATALSHLGYKVTSTNVGTLVFGTAARVARRQDAEGGAGDHRGQRQAGDDGVRADRGAARLHAGDDGDAQRGGLLDQRRRGLRRRPGGAEADHAGGGAEGPPSSRAAARPSSSPSSSGIQPETQQSWHFPIDVTVHTQNIGGPSAGLAMTLGIMDKLTSGRLTGNRIVAATGEIDQYGNVSAVGGVAEKTIAVENAGRLRLLRAARRRQPGGREIQGHPPAARLRGAERQPGAAHPRAAGRPRAQHHFGAGPGGAVGFWSWQTCVPPSPPPAWRPGTSRSRSFAVVRRGFDSDEVRSYLQSVSRSIEALEEREQELRAALAEAEERAAHPVIDESTLTASLGQHSAQILRHAHEEAAKIVAQAQEGAATLVRETHSQVDELQARTESAAAERVAEVEIIVANAEQEARVESERILSDAVAEGEAVIEQAKNEGRALLEQVQEARRRVLADLASRRRALGIQIEQLRAARDEMAASVHGVRDRVDAILSHLDRTDEEARAAAVAVAEQYRLHGGPRSRTTRRPSRSWATCPKRARLRRSG